MLFINLELPETSSAEEEALDSGDSDDFDPLTPQIAGSSRKFDPVLLAIPGK